MKEAAGLKGTIQVQGSKNTVLPIIAATLLTDGISVIHNCPEISDVRAMRELLECLNVRTSFEDHVLVIDTTDAIYAPLPVELTKKLRSSILLLGPMLAKWGKAEIGLPGGCNIGMRPIDIHMEGLGRMKVDICCDNDVLICDTFHLQGCEFHLRYPSVGATENLLMAAAKAKGRTVLRGAAKEPEIIELCHYLISIGVVIEGIGTDTLFVKGSSNLTPADYINVYDRIVAGTYILMAAAVPSDIKLMGIEDVHYIKNIIRTAARLGVNVVKFENYLSIQSCGKVISGVYETGIYPEFPTDLMPVLIAVMLKADECCEVVETVFENRFSVVDELKKLNGKLTNSGNRVQIYPGSKLQGHTVRATDLRQGAAMVVAGLISKGYTTVTNIAYIERGYEDIVRDLRCVGAEVSYT